MVFDTHLLLHSFTSFTRWQNLHQKTPHSRWSLGVTAHSRRSFAVRFDPDSFSTRPANGILRARSSVRKERRTSNPTVVGSNPIVPVQRGAQRRVNRHVGFEAGSSFAATEVQIPSHPLVALACAPDYHSLRSRDSYRGRSLLSVAAGFQRDLWSRPARGQCTCAVRDQFIRSSNLLSA